MTGGAFVLGLMGAVLLVQAQTRTADCLATIPGQTAVVDAADRRFDAEFDRARSGGSFSCDLGIRASEVREALDRFRAAVLYRDEETLKGVVEFPLPARVWKSRGDLKGSAVQITAPREWWDFERRYLGTLELAAIACANVLSVDIVKSRTYGFTIADGLVWFQRGQHDQRVKVTAVNVVPLRDVDFVRACRPSVRAPQEGMGPK